MRGKSLKILMVVCAFSFWEWSTTYAEVGIKEPVLACVFKASTLNAFERKQAALCLDWRTTAQNSLCGGAYLPDNITPISTPEAYAIQADKVTFYNTFEKPSKLQGHVQFQETQRIVTAETAYIYRDAKTQKVNKVILLNNVRFKEPDKLLVANKVTFNPEDKSGEIENVLYRIETNRGTNILPAWGRAAFIQRFSNNDLLFKKATYTTCAPEDNAWEIRAKEIALDSQKGVGVARHAVLRFKDKPVFYTPYASFPTNKERKSGFLMPVPGYSSPGGVDVAFPYYFNLAPNYDLTLIPHPYSKRGVMMGGVARYLSNNGSGIFEGNYLPQDRAVKGFVQDTMLSHPEFSGFSPNRWSVGIQQHAQLSPNLQMNVNFQQVSDDYYLQDFSTNLAVLTERQLLRQGDLTYTTNNWQFRSLVQSYQTLNPVNESVIDPIYERLPQLMAMGYYGELPLHANLRILGQYDQFHWPNRHYVMPEGPRFHFNPVLSIPVQRPWGFFTPSVELVENYYSVDDYWGYNKSHTFNRSIPRFSVDSGLFFERKTQFARHRFTQTLEPRLYYLHVPYQNQTAIPVYDSANLIFNVDQLFRTNRFSGYDRIGDANQLAYAVKTRWISDETGAERASFAIGQLYYFSDRKVPLCQSITGSCIDNPNALGFLSPTEQFSPLASRAVYYFAPRVSMTADYIWDPATQSTNNGQLTLDFQKAPNALLRFGYTYLVNGDIARMAGSGIQKNALHQATIAYAWPFNERWSTLGAYNYNLSKGYDMMSFFGVQYDSCCWTARLLGGRSFQSLNEAFSPRYTNNVYLQVVLKGLGSMASSDPSVKINTYLPGYRDPLRG